MSRDRNKCEVTEIERMAYEMDRLFVEAETKQTIPKKHPSIVKAEVLYNAGYRKQEWISVEDRIPAVGDTCLVVVKMKYAWETEWEYNVDVAAFVFFGGYIDDVWNTFNDWNECQVCHVTHWMPLPEAPKMKGGAE